MGCVVNGPGESKAANIGVSLPGSGESPVAPVYVDGKKHKVLKGDNISGEFINMVESYVEKMEINEYKYVWDQKNYLIFYGKLIVKILKI